MLRKDRKWNHMKHLIETTKGRKKVEDKKYEHRTRQQIEHSNKYGSY